MKVYLVDVDNGESHEDYSHWVEKIYTSYRDASQYLIDEGFEAYFDYNDNDEIEVDFYWEKSKDHYADCSWARIIEMDIEEYK